MKEDKTHSLALSSRVRKLKQGGNVGPLKEEFCDQPDVQKDLGLIGKCSSAKINDNEKASSSWRCPIGASIFVCSTVVAAVSAFHVPAIYAVAPTVVIGVLALTRREKAGGK